MVIPLDQQQYFAVMRTVNVKISLKYTNLEYESYVDSGMNTFQDLLISLYFASAAQTVQPMVSVSNTLMLKGEDLQVDATETFVENVPDEDKQKDLVFSWECSSLIQAICTENAG